jgi:hypothetical protein
MSYTHGKEENTYNHPPPPEILPSSGTGPLAQGEKWTNQVLASAIKQEKAKARHIVVPSKSNRLYCCCCCCKTEPGEKRRDIYYIPSLP